ncbi:unnamed protein product [Vitrella brassicaformis CCMP3155]|uniref:3-hydroxybutyryl-CoA dehydrogenase n=2 Tax=Vitrella brassicaformis TaxID=1169539 RepID=A0A0G4EL38_VITBC|nr:unnamed protein product [Vitrella brassicaformis CCMP3155]|eukprot:CEL97709.1 unnamed protein product [Vitrella brassicaformis CCMP3155]
MAREAVRQMSSASSSASSINRIAVVGAGQMGTGIAIVAAHVGRCAVSLFDSCGGQLAKSEKFVASWLEKEVGKGRMSAEDSQGVAARLSYVNLKDDAGTATHLSHKDMAFAIEAVVEDFGVKREVLGVLDRQMPPQAILATNTSSISITKLAATTNRAQKVIGMHFMNPVPKMPLVEVIKGLATDEETLSTTMALGKVGFGKETAVSEDRPGFVSNRVLMPYINEAVFTLQEGIASVEDIDKILKLGTNVPMGPLTLADFIGLDTCLYVMRVLHTELGDSKYRPAPLLVQYVDAGWLGRKSGRGFYRYQ